MTVEDEGTTRATTSLDGGVTVREWAQARRTVAQRLRRDAVEMRARAVTLRRSLHAQRGTVPDATGLRRRLVAAERRAANLEVALASNRRISQAVGILMARRGLTEEQAFEQLRQCSSRRNVKLAVVADDVVYTGELPPPSGGR